MTVNTDNAIRHIQDARGAIFVETGDTETIEKMDEAENLIRVYDAD